MRLHCRVIPLLLAVIVSVSTADAAITFNVSQVSVPLDRGGGPLVMVLADVNRDGFPDIVGINETKNGFDVFLNDKSGGFSSEPSTSTMVGDDLAAIAGGDFDNDGKPDIVVVDNANDEAIFLFGDGSGQFSDRQTLSVSNGPVAVGVADLNNDRIDDAAIVGGDSGEEVYLIKSNGNRTFVPFSPATVATRSTGGFAIATGLFDANTFVDLVVTDYDEARVSVLLGNGDGTFKTARLNSVGANPKGIVVAKLDADATQDLAVVDSGEIADLNVSLLYGNNDGTFKPGQRTTAEVLSVGIAAADFDQDGQVDLAVTNGSDGQGVAVLRNNPGCADCAPPSCDCTNGFEIMIVQGLGNAQAIQAGDLNHDGKPDIVALGDDGTLGVFLNTTGNVTPTNTPSTPSTSPSSTPRPTVVTATPTITLTFTPTSTLTPTPVPTPYGVCPTRVGGQPVALATGDFDQDGNTDVAVADQENGRIKLLLSHISTGGTTPCAILGLTNDAAKDITGIDGPVALAAQDLDGDGKLDLAVVGAAGLSVFYGNGQGGFSPAGQNPMPAGITPQGIAIADFNRDGVPDIIVANEASDNVSIFLGAGQRQFDAPCNIAVGGHATGVVAADLNLDGRADFAVFSDQTNAVYVLLQIVSAGGGTPTPTPVNMCPAGTSGFRALTPIGLPLNAIPRAMLVTNLDVGDLTPDFAVALSAAGRTDGQAQVLLGAAVTGGVNYSPQQPFKVPGTPKTSEPSAIGAGDINRDGRLDLVIADKNNDDLLIFLAQSDGSFSLPLNPIPVMGKGPVAVALADIDGDGKPDTVVANQDDGSVSFLITRGAPSTPTPVPTYTATSTATVTPTATETVTFTATATALPTSTQTPRNTGLPTNTATPQPPATIKPGTVSLNGSCALIDPQRTRQPNGLVLLAVALAGWLARRSARGRVGR